MSSANAPKTQLGRYQLVRHLVSGGMADLWIAKTTTEHVALKRLHVEQARDQRFVQAFLDEVRIACTLRHPNIARVHDVGHEQGEYFVAMEWVHGVDLRQVLMHAFAHDQHLPIEHAMHIALATTAALKHAHAHGIVHSDVAPANIVVGYDGAVKVLDFGLATAAHRTRDTQPGVMKGKVSYMSPEQCVGQAVDARSDIYSLGIVLYELMTVRRLFKAANDFLAMTAILHGEVPLPSTVRAGVPPELDAIIMTALAPDPQQRFQRVEDMREALERYCNAKHIRTSPASLAEYLRKAFGKQPEPWLVDAAPPPLPVDFDGTQPGVVPVPEVAAVLGPVATPAAGDEATDIVAPLPLVLPGAEGPLSVGDATMLVRPAPIITRRRTGFAIVAIVAVAAIAAAVFAFARPRDDDDPRLQANPNIKLPPPSNPAPVVIPALAPDAPAVVEEEAKQEVVAEPPPPVKQETVQKKKKKKAKRPTRRPRKPEPTESTWDREALFPK